MVDKVLCLEVSVPIMSELYSEVGRKHFVFRDFTDKTLTLGILCHFKKDWGFRYRFVWGDANA